ncbi:polysaccharide biosynthesis tyrosine autokinase [Hyphomicrobium sp. CS1BSMeth3]|uniref:GumC family protein n=1 Tax=Hyphomicrobium sp. CS1BSMeth3 TaxID=1892844 RepID=UPI0009319176|nr:polysaccharide biosynthesis tyrosine autokinase [Hyphomicrobium sp. CS1BSMeth3]
MSHGRAVAPGVPEGNGGRLVAQSDATLARGYYGGPPHDDEPRDDEFRRLLLESLRIALKRKWLILTIAFVAVAIGGLRTLMITPLYSAAVRVQVEPQSLKIVERGQVEQPETGDAFLRTQIELLRSNAIAQRVSKLAGLADDPDFFKPREFSILEAARSFLGGAAAQEEVTPSKAALEEAAAGIVASNQSVRPLPGSRLVDISYSDPSPARAARVANAYADAFIASNLDRRLQANVYAKAFLEDQLVQLKVRHEEAEKAVVAFAEKEEFVVTSEKSSIAEANLSAANAALGGLIAERIKTEQLWRQVEKIDEINLPQFLLNPVVQGLRSARNVLDGEYKEKLQTFKPGYPAMVQISNRMKEIDRQIAAEVKAIKDSHKAAFEQARRQEDEMRARIETLRVETLDLQRRGIQYDNLRREAATLRTLYEGLLQRHKEVDVAGGIGANNIFIVDRAEAPGAPYAPNLVRALLMALVIGLGGGCGAAYLLERLDDAVRLPEELERVTALPTLGVIPDVGEPGEAERALIDPRSGLAEAYRSLCTALQFATEQGLPKSLLVTSAMPGEGKSVTSLAVARHFANMGLRVLLVDADLRNPSMHHKLGLEHTVGLSSYLSGELSPPEAFQGTDIPNLTFMSSGPLPTNAADLLAGPRLLSLLSVGMETFDLIVLDSPPIMGLADAPLLSNAAATTLLVVSSGKARSGQVRGALKRLRFARGPVIGTALTRFDARNAGYGYGYAYGYGYGVDPYVYGGPKDGEQGREQARLTQS